MTTPSPKPMPWLQLPLTLVLILLVGACAPVVEQPANSSSTAIAIDSQPEIKNRPFPPDTLYDLLVAEMAAHHGQYAITLKNYLKQAAKTRDPAVTARATRIAQYLRAEQAALEAALLWVEVEPDNTEARYIAATQLAKAKRPFDALTHMQVAYELQGRTNFAVVAASALRLPEADQKIMLENIQGLLETAPDSPDLLVAQAILQQSVVSEEVALETIQTLLDIRPNHVQALFIEASLIQQIDPEEDPYQRVKALLEREPKNRQVRLQYARTLIKTDPSEAIAQFEILTTQFPKDPEVLLPLAALYAESRQFEEARALFEKLLELKQQTSVANYYLGGMAQQQGLLDQAVEHYKLVTPGQHFGAALQRTITILDQQGQTAEAESWLGVLRGRYPSTAPKLYQLQANLLITHKQYPAAYDLLTEALAQHPDNPDLLYNRSIVSEKQGNVDLLESDLRQMLQLDPNNAQALNALGYSLTNLTDRYTEALELIQQALTLKPEDPAIMDSMGWVQYRLGNYHASLQYLRKAMDLFPDHEVAAHLVEVLWTLGEKEQAWAVYNEALTKQPDSEFLQQTMQRLDANSESIKTSGK